MIQTLVGKTVVILTLIASAVSAWSINGHLFGKLRLGSWAIYAGANSNPPKFINFSGKHRTGCTLRKSSFLSRSSQRDATNPD